MAYNTRSIKRDVDGRPVPQYFNSTTDDYEPLLGENGAARSVLYGPNGQPLSVIDNKLAVRAADLETLIGALNDSAVTNPANAASVIAALKGLLSVVGKEATLGQILSALGALATETTLGGVKTAVDVLAGTVDTQAGVQKVALSGRIAQVSASKSVSRFGSLAAGTEEVLAEVQREAIIHDVLIKYDRDDPGARVFMDLWDGTQFRPLVMAYSPSSQTGRITPSDVLYNGLFEVLVNTHPNYAVRLREPMRVAGFRLRVSNILQQNIWIAASVVWSEV